MWLLLLSIIGAFISIKFKPDLFDNWCRLSTLGFLVLEDGVTNGNFGIADYVCIFCFEFELLLF